MEIQIDMEFLTPLMRIILVLFVVDIRMLIYIIDSLCEGEAPEAV